MDDWDDWGVRSTMDGIPHQRDPYNCPHCNYNGFRDGEVVIFYNYIVGFSSDRDCIVMECPECFKRFWRHISDSWIKIYTRNAKEKPDYFKAPGACEELLNMLKEQKKK